MKTKYEDQSIASSASTEFHNAEQSSKRNTARYLDSWKQRSEYWSSRKFETNNDSQNLVARKN